MANCPLCRKRLINLLTLKEHPTLNYFKKLSQTDCINIQGIKYLCKNRNCKVWILNSGLDLLACYNSNELEKLIIDSLIKQVKVGE